MYTFFVSVFLNHTVLKHSTNITLFTFSRIFNKLLLHASYHVYVCNFIKSSVRSLTKLNATVTSRQELLGSYREKLTALGGESCNSSREVTVAFNFISERTL
jgi:hypothetical protein